MFKKSFIPFTLIILVLISCVSNTNSKSQLEGAWVQSYSQFLDDDGTIHSDFYPSGPKFFVDFKGNKVRFKKIEIKGKDRMADTIVNFTLKDGKITLDNEDPLNKIEIKVTKDSLVMTSHFGQTRHIIFKRLPTTSERVDWSPEGKEYVIFYGGEKIYYDYINDAEMYSYSQDVGSLMTTYWDIQNINNYTFLVYQPERDADVNADNTYLLVDSLAGKKVYVTDYLLKKEQYVIEEQEIAHEKPRSLFGTWKLVSKEEIVQHTTQIELPGSMNGLDKLYIEEDSIIINRPPFKPKVAWKYYENDKTIILKRLNKVLQVSKVSKDSLVLEMDLSQHGSQNKRFTFIRE